MDNTDHSGIVIRHTAVLRNSAGIAVHKPANDLTPLGKELEKTIFAMTYYGDHLLENDGLVASLLGTGNAIFAIVDPDKDKNTVPTLMEMRRSKFIVHIPRPLVDKRMQRGRIEPGFQTVRRFACSKKRPSLCCPDIKTA